jgi:hypothetical protein
MYSEGEYVPSYSESPTANVLVDVVEKAMQDGLPIMPAGVIVDDHDEPPFVVIASCGVRGEPVDV